MSEYSMYLFIRHFWCIAFILLLLLEPVRPADGEWKLTFPPWEDPPTRPRMHIGLIGPFTRHGCFPSRYLSQRIAASHVNRRDSTYCPAIANLKNDFEISYDLGDTNANGITGTKVALEIEKNGTKVILGPNSSGTSKKVSTVLTIFGIPHISWAATNADLSNKASYPNFFRVVAPDSLVLAQLALFVASLAFTKVNVVFFDSPFQSGQSNNFRTAAETTHSMEVFAYKVKNSGEGGAKVSDANRPEMIEVLQAISRSTCRVVAGFAINSEAYDLWKAAFDVGMIRNAGWIWFGADGISGGMLEGDVNRLDPFVGTVFLLSKSKGPKFADYAARWKKDMPKTQRPEFTVMKLCAGGVNCVDHPEFGWKDDVHAKELVCQGYTAFAYDAMVTLAVVFDRILSSKKIAAEEVTSQDWFDEMKTLNDPQKAFDCLSGKIAFNENQERPLPIEFYNWQPGSMDPVLIANWNSADGIVWETGISMYWPSGDVVDVSSPSGPTQIPSGTLPVCAINEIYDTTQQKCRECRAGRFKPQGDADNSGTASCFLCPEGSFQPMPGALTCIPCAPGNFSNVTGQTACSECSAGRFIASTGQTECMQCETGTFQPSEGSSACVRCPIGEYADSQGQTDCKICSSRFTTLYQAARDIQECVCSEGYYMPLKGSQCKLCPTGMICQAGSAIANYNHSAKSQLYPVLEPRFWSPSADPTSVFLCANTDVCPGGMPGACPRNLRGQMCAACPDETRRSGDKCFECSNLETSKVLFPVLPTVFGPVFVVLYYYMLLSPVSNWGSWRNGIGVLMLIILNHYQMIALIRETKVQMTEAVKDWWYVWSYLNNVMNILSPDCAGLTDFTAAYITNALLPLAIGVIFVETYFLSKLFQRISGKPGLGLNEMLNEYFSLIYTFYIAVCKGAIDAFLCSDHPNETSTLQRAPTVFCGSEEHSTMVIVGIFALLVFCICSGCMFCYQLYWAPTIFHQGWFQLRWKFLILKFRPDVWWWGAVWLLKGLLMNLMLLNGTSFGQLFGLFVVMCVYLILTVSFAPWRHISANIFDRLVCVSILLVTFLALCNASFSTESPEAETWAIVASFSPFVVLVILGICLCLKGLGPVQQDDHDRLRLLSVHLHKSFGSLSQLKEQRLTALLHRLTSHDRRALTAAADIILAEVHGEQPRTYRMGQRLIVSERVLHADDFDDHTGRHSQSSTASTMLEYSCEKCGQLQLDLASPACKSLEALKAAVQNKTKVELDEERISSFWDVTSSMVTQSPARVSFASKDNGASTCDVRVEEEQAMDDKVPDETPQRQAPAAQDIPMSLTQYMDTEVNNFKEKLRKRELEVHQLKQELGGKGAEVDKLQGQVRELKSGLSILNGTVSASLSLQKRMALQMINNQVQFSLETLESPRHLAGTSPRGTSRQPDARYTPRNDELVSAGVD